MIYIDNLSIQLIMDPKFNIKRTISVLYRYIYCIEHLLCIDLKIDKTKFTLSTNDTVKMSIKTLINYQFQYPYLYPQEFAIYHYQASPNTIDSQHPYTKTERGTHPHLLTSVFIKKRFFVHATTASHSLNGICMYVCIY